MLFCSPGHPAVSSRVRFATTRYLRVEMIQNAAGNYGYALIQIVPVILLSFTSALHIAPKSPIKCFVVIVNCLLSREGDPPLNSEPYVLFANKSLSNLASEGHFFMVVVITNQKSIFWDSKRPTYGEAIISRFNFLSRFSLTKVYRWLVIAVIHSITAVSDSTLIWDSQRTISKSLSCDRACHARQYGIM